MTRFDITMCGLDGKYFTEKEKKKKEKENE